MNIIELNEKAVQPGDSRLNNLYKQCRVLVQELNRKVLPDPVAEYINRELEQINTSAFSGNDFRKQLKATQTRILKLLEKQLKIVPKNYYRNLWLSIGIAAFGLPVGLCFGLSLHMPGISGVGVPIGMAIGAAIGSGMDKKALDEGRQLDIEIKY